MTLAIPAHKRGQCFVLTINLYDAETKEAILDATTRIKSQIRNAKDELIAELIVTPSVTDGVYVLTAADTSTWIPGETLYMDVRYEDINKVPWYSETIEFKVFKEVTRLP